MQRSAPLSVELALTRILSSVQPLAPEQVALDQALDRVLATDLAARRDQPSFDNSAMDGYAVRQADLAAFAGTAQLHVVGEIAAGASEPLRIGAGEAMRIFTGAPIPDGADLVIPQENVEPISSDQSEIAVRLARDFVSYIRRRGADFSRGELVLSAYTRLDPRQIALAAAMNYRMISVVRQPQVGIISCGNELRTPGSELSYGQIVASNAVALAGFIRRWGGVPCDLGVFPDCRDSLAAAIGDAMARGCDVIVTSGGASVGKHDVVRQAAQKAGMEIDFWKIAMRPGKPLFFARDGACRLLGLPGNPVSVAVCGRIFLRSLIRAHLGLDVREPLPWAKLASAVPKNGPRQHYMRGRFEPSSGSSETLVYPYPEQDSGLMKLLAAADCLLIRPPHAPALAAGEAISYMPLPGG